MPIDFPDFPSLNDTFTVGNKSWTYDGVKWNVESNTQPQVIQSEEWIRPSDWLDLTPPTSSEQKFVGLYAVYNKTSNNIALRCSVSSGTYTVDWGDGSTPVTISSGVVAQYNYSYSSLNSSTESSRGYRQAIVTVTPTSSGATFSSVELNHRHSSKSTRFNSVHAWLDVAVSCPNATSLVLSGTSTGASTVLILSMLERINVVSHNVSNMSYMLAYNRVMQSVSLSNTSSVTNMSYMFDGCWGLKSVPLFDTSSVTNMQGMFRGCGALKSLPLFNTISVTDMTDMLQGCNVLQSVPFFNTSSVTNMSGMLRNCYSIETIPLFNTSSVVNMTNIFLNSQALRILPGLNISKINSVANNNLQVTTIGSLGKAPLLNNRWTLSFGNTNIGSSELNEMYTSLAVLNPNVVNISGNGSTVTYTVDDITAFVTGRTVTITGVNPSSYNLTNATVGTVDAVSNTFTVSNTTQDTYVSGGVAAIQDNRTITVTGNPGITGDNPTIATAKGWTVTGS